MQYIMQYFLLSCLAGVATCTVFRDTNDTEVIATPPAIMRVLTEHLTVKCRLPHDGGPDGSFRNVISLIISKSDVTEGFREVASITEYSRDQVIIENQTLVENAAGQILPNKDAWIELDWNEPGTHLAGVYRCEAFGVDKYGHPKTSVSTFEVKESPVDVDTALNKILELRQTVTDQLRQTDISGKLLGSCYNNSDVLSMVSAPFNNSHFYYLSQASRKNISAAQEICKQVDGIVAEVDNQEEYDFVRNFTLSKLSSAQRWVFLGATDSQQEGVWKYVSDGRNVTFLDWGPGTSNTNKYNCLFLHNSHGGMRMEDAECTGSTAPVLCEVEIQ